MAAGDVIRFVYVQDNAQGIPGYVPPATEGGQGSLSINKDKLVSNLAQLSQSQIDANRQVYEKALLVAADGASTQAEVNEQTEVIAQVLAQQIPATDITVTPTSVELMVGQSQQLTAQLTPQDATDPVSWESDNPTCVTVDDSGMVVARGAGSAQITATSGAFQAVCQVTVTARPAPTTPTVVFQHTDGRITPVDETGTITLSALDEGKFVLEGVDPGQSTYWSCQEQNRESESSIVHISSGGKFYPTVGESPAYVYDKNPDWYEAEKLAHFTLKVVPTQVTDLKLYLDGCACSVCWRCLP